MKRAHYSSYAARAIALAVLAVSVVGCCDVEKKQISQLTAANQQLEAQNRECQANLATARSTESQLMGQLESKDAMIMALQTENQELKNRPAAPPAPLPPGAERTVFTESVGADVLFNAGRATLTSKGKSKLSSIISTLRNNYPGMDVRVMGYTDGDPIVKSKKLWKDNLDLSANRAMEVTRYLRSKGISAEKIETVAMGATHFVKPNTSKTGKAANRRVEILVVKK